MKRTAVGLLALILLVSYPLPAQATKSADHNNPIPTKCWDSLAKFSMEFGHSYTDRQITYDNSSSDYNWAVINCRRNDFLTVVQAYASQYRTLKDYDYYGEPATILKGSDPNKFRVFVCKQVRKYLRENNRILKYPNLACK